MDKAWLQAAKEGDVSAMKALADHYEEQGDKLRAAQWRCKAGLSRVVYQVYNTENGEVVHEYKTMGACKAFIGSIQGYKDRSTRRVRVMEFIAHVVADVKPELTRDSNWSWTGPVTIIAGEFCGKSGEVLGYAPSGNRRVLLDGVEHLVPFTYLKFLQ